MVSQVVSLLCVRYSVSRHIKYWFEKCSYAMVEGCKVTESERAIPVPISGLWRNCPICATYTVKRNISNWNGGRDLIIIHIARMHWNGTELEKGSSSRARGILASTNPHASPPLWESSLLGLGLRWGRSLPGTKSDGLLQHGGVSKIAVPPGRVRVVMNLVEPLGFVRRHSTLSFVLVAPVTGICQSSRFLVLWLLSRVKRYLNEGKRRREGVKTDQSSCEAVTLKHSTKENESRATWAL